MGTLHAQHQRITEAAGVIRYHIGNTMLSHMVLHT
jgi:hypothetical protein